MMRVFVAAAALLLSACAVQLVSPYDEAIEKGILEFQEQFNTLVKNASDLRGKPEGTYDASIKGYNALDSKIDILIQRASMAAEGKACKLEAKLQAKLAQALKNEIPVQLRADSQGPEGSAAGCNTRLLEIVKLQLTDVRELHKVGACGAPPVSCLRRDAATDAQKITNQAIYAVYVVEASKK